MRILFGWKAASTRADLELVLTAEQPQSGFSPEEAVMLKNILGLRETRIERIMVPRADIVAVQQDIALGDLVKVFEVAGHSRLVVYNDTLDDPTGMVHIRDLIAFMAARAAQDQTTASDREHRQRPPIRRTTAADLLNFANIDLSMPLAAAKIVREILYAPPSMPALDLLAKMQATRIHLALVIDEYGGSDGLVSIEDLVELIVGDIADEHDEDEGPDGDARRATARSLPTAAPASTTCAPRSATSSMSARSPTKSTRSAAISSPRPAMCRCAANWCPDRSRSKPKCSTPIRAGSSASRFICARIAVPAPARRAGAAAQPAARPPTPRDETNRPNPNTPRTP